MQGILHALLLMFSFKVYLVVVIGGDIYILDGINSLAKLNIYSVFWSNFVSNLHEDQKLKKEPGAEEPLQAFFFLGKVGIPFFSEWTRIFLNNSLPSFLVRFTFCIINIWPVDKPRVTTAPNMGPIQGAQPAAYPIPIKIEPI